MEILYARHLFRPADLGGNRYPWEVTRRLARRGHRIRVVTPVPAGPLPGPLEVDLVTYPVSTRTPLHTFGTNALGARRALYRELARRPADVVVLSSYDVAYGYLSRARQAVPTVFIYHSSFFSDAIDRLATLPWPLRLAHAPVEAFRCHVEAVTFARCDRIVAVSPLSKREILERVPAASPRVVLIPTGVDLERYTPGDRGSARGRLGLPRDAVILLLVARLVPVKRQDLAIRAVASLRERGRHCLLVLVGDGPEEPRLRTLAAAAGVHESVRFAGFIGDEDELQDHFRAADLTLCTSAFENWSLALLESLACGTPVVGTPGGSIADLVSLVDPDLVVPGESPEAIAHTVERTLARSDLSELRTRARSVVADRFGWDRTAEALEDCLAAVAAAR